MRRNNLIGLMITLELFVRAMQAQDDFYPPDTDTDPFLSDNDRMIIGYGILGGGIVGCLYCVCAFLGSFIFHFL